MVSWIHIFSELDKLGLELGSTRAAAASATSGGGGGYFGPGQLRGGRFRVAFHLVRDPLSSITSLVCTEPIFREDYWRYIRRHVRMDEELRRSGDKVRAGLAMYVQWHEFLDELEIPRVRLEDLFDTERGYEEVRRIFSRLGRRAPGRGAFESMIKRGNQHKVNARSHRKRFSWDELYAVDKGLTMRTWEMSRRYGYVYSEKPGSRAVGYVVRC
eukprot:763037-Hanusia_phi.AAC.2